MGTTAQGASDFGRAIARYIRRELGDRQISNREYARNIGRSEFYVRSRIGADAEKEFSLGDIDETCKYFGITVEQMLADLDK